ncbi:hypothetical protein EYF80_033030 [Liparis tanakae]|uniref:Uncharacterized protein n=1 Tax=Liparis tanakae TaxID=230148 RepID=A0A4Z2GVK2_9TELE|nr:hypothetical protein EYF80_033030 [Liparis tanakae]
MTPQARRRILSGPVIGSSSHSPGASQETRKRVARRVQYRHAARPRVHFRARCVSLSSYFLFLSPPTSCFSPHRHCDIHQAASAPPSKRFDHGVHRALLHSQNAVSRQSPLLTA